MAYSESRIGRIWVREQAAWGTPFTIVPASHAASSVECEITYPELAQEALSVDTVRGGFHSAPVTAGAKIGTSITLTMPLHGWSAATPSDNATEHVDALLLKHALGGSSLAGWSSDVLASGQDSATVIKYGDGSGALNMIGNAVLIPVSGGHSVGWVTSGNVGGDPDLLTVLNALSANASDSAQPYGSNTCYLTTGMPSVPLTVQWQGSDADAGVRLSDGAVTSATITCSPQQQPTLSVTLNFLDWDEVTGLGSPGLYSHSLPQMPILTGSNDARLVMGSDLHIDAASFEITIENEMATIGSHSGNEGASVYYATNRTVTGSLTIPTAAALGINAPGTDPGALQLDLAGTPGNALSILVPEPVLTEVSQIGDNDGLVAETLSFGCNVMLADATTGAGAAVNSPFRVAFL
tara:strand:- start:2179 stop:3405 length:1227 start_codon:yes stop_codon:yes gene_type:complete